MRLFENVLFQLVVLPVLLLGFAPAVHGAEMQLHGRRFTLPDGFQRELVASSPLVDRPISADFDELGRLYVTESNGSNEDVQIQLEKKPHHVVRLEDTDGDGRFDTRTVFADRLAFPEGAMWYDGSLYVAAPPQIWKLTDSDDDGVADHREVWFDGQTLGHCANDLHGPFLGPDGWIYWCKGAFAEQTYERPGLPPLATRASHMFRRHPSGGWVEVVMSGGMDNPVEVAFTPGGERIFSTTFLTHPGNGQRDGLIHALYGGVYGKQHGVLDGHPRTGELLPPLVHQGASAPCGLTALRSTQLGDGYADSLLCCSFNMHKVTRHILRPAGGTFQSSDHDFLVCDDLDFHPTDVLEDADGSVLVVDTGGWYKLCCPTSQLYKPDVLGGIYRIRRRGGHQVVDPRGLEIDWGPAAPDRLAGFLADPRHVVRERAKQALIQQVTGALPALGRVLHSSPSAAARRHAVWTLAQIDATEARRLLRQALGDSDELVRQAAAHAASVHRDAEAVEQLIALLGDAALHNRRVAAEALGRVGDPAAIEPLLAAAADCRDRALEHSLIYAVMEIGSAEQTRGALDAENPYVRRAALIAIDQMPGAGLEAAAVVPLLSQAQPELRETAWWLAGRHTEWAPQLAGYFQQQLESTDLGPQEESTLAQHLARFAGQSAIQETLAAALPHAHSRTLVLRAMAASGLRAMPAAWSAALERLFAESIAGPTEPTTVEPLVTTAHALAGDELPPEIRGQLERLADDIRLPESTRLKALAAASRAGKRKGGELSQQALRFVAARLAVEHPPAERALAVDILSAVKLAPGEMVEVAAALVASGPLEWKALLPVLAQSGQPAVGSALLDALRDSEGAYSFDPEELQKHLSRFDADTLSKAAPIVARLREQNRDKLERMESVLALLEAADARNGQRIFQGTKAACAACHQMGYLGGNLGPDLSRIGRIRSQRDLLESVMFPNISFVRSYEPVQILTSDGQVYNGLVRDETSDEVVLALDAQKVVHIAHDEIELRERSQVSIMPSGLDQQFTPQELADLILFLKVSR